MRRRRWWSNLRRVAVRRLPLRWLPWALQTGSTAAAWGKQIPWRITYRVRELCITSPGSCGIGPEQRRAAQSGPESLRSGQKGVESRCDVRTCRCRRHACILCRTVIYMAGWGIERSSCPRTRPVSSLRGVALRGCRGVAHAGCECAGLTISWFLAVWTRRGTIRGGQSNAAECDGRQVVRETEFYIQCLQAADRVQQRCLAGPVANQKRPPDLAPGA